MWIVVVVRYRATWAYGAGAEKAFVLGIYRHGTPRHWGVPGDQLSHGCGSVSDTF